MAVDHVEDVAPAQGLAHVPHPPAGGGEAEAKPLLVRDQDWGREPGDVEVGESQLPARDLGDDVISTYS